MTQVSKSVPSSENLLNQKRKETHQDFVEWGGDSERRALPTMLPAMVEVTGTTQLRRGMAQWCGFRSEQGHCLPATVETVGTTHVHSFKGREGVGIVPSVTAVWRRQRGKEFINAMLKRGETHR